jgi:uncharacterized membrane protein
MADISTITSTVTAAFLGAFVEMVEAFTIVLAVGLERSWRPAFIGTAAAVIVLVALVIAFGPLLAFVPLHLLQFVVGVLLILFGLRWLRKAVLRAAGFIALHDEDKAFREETAALRRQAADRRADTLAGLAAFKAVLLEGIEVVFIVIAVGAGNGLTLYASLGALAALVVVLAIGAAIHRPLAQIPENTLKFAVGLMLTSFGIFWIGEGLGAEWPGADLALLGIVALLAISAIGLVRWLRRLAGPAVQGPGR